MGRAVVIVAVRVVGFHHWPDAPPEVGYLKDDHRHIFTVRVEWPVGHDDRDVEFHTAQRWMLAALAQLVGHAPHDVAGPFRFGARSCEMVARELLTRLNGTLHPVPSAAEVWEDDECGARVEQEV